MAILLGYNKIHSWRGVSLVVFRSGTDLMSLLILLFFLIEWPLQNKPKTPVVTNRIGMNFGRIVPPVNTHWLTKSDFRYDVTLSRWWPWRHFTHKSVAIWWVNAKRLLGDYAAASTVPVLQCSTFVVLVIVSTHDPNTKRAYFIKCPANTCIRCNAIVM